MEQSSLHLNLFSSIYSFGGNELTKFLKWGKHVKYIRGDWIIPGDEKASAKMIGTDAMDKTVVETLATLKKNGITVLKVNKNDSQPHILPVSIAAAVKRKSSGSKTKEAADYDSDGENGGGVGDCERNFHFGRGGAAFLALYLANMNSR